MRLSTTCRWPTPRDVFANTENGSRNGTFATKCLSRSGDNSVALLPKFGWQEAGQGTAAKWDGKGALRYILHTVPVAQMSVVAGMVTGVHIIGTSVVMAYFRCPTSCPAIMMVVGKQCEQHEQYNCQRHVICAAGGFHFMQRWCKVSAKMQVYLQSLPNRSLSCAKIGNVVCNSVACSACLTGLSVAYAPLLWVEVVGACSQIV